MKQVKLKAQFMRSLFKLNVLITWLVLLLGCTKTESDFSVSPAAMESAPAEGILLKASRLSVVLGNSVTFTVNSSKNGNNLTSDSKIFINGTLINGYSYTFTEVGTYNVYATKNALTSNVATIMVVPTDANLTKGFVKRVLVEEFSGTWCGNCPRILYGVDLLKEQTAHAIVVGIHLFNGDPFITSNGNNLANNLGVSSVPAGFINRTIVWNGPQYQNVKQVIGQITPSSEAGIAINSSVVGNRLTVGVKLSYDRPSSSTSKITVYLVEDRLVATQSNYSSNLYGGCSSIPNFKYDGVLRAIISDLGGDDSSTNEKNYTIDIPKNIASLSNASIVAFVTAANGTVLNVQQAKIGENKEFEKL